MILLKQGEMILKGANKRSFEQRLEEAVRRRTGKYGSFRVYSKQSVVYVEPTDESTDETAAALDLSRQFGIVSLSQTVSCEKNPEAILIRAREYLGEELNKAKSFKVESRRADKRFPMTSIELSRYIGGELHEAYPNLVPDMHTPELTIRIEIRDEAAYISGSPIRGAGGLPPGASGRAVLLLSGGIDSPVAGYLAAKRGLRITPVHFHSFPYTSPAAKQKAEDLAKILTAYCGSMTLYNVSLTEIQEEIEKKCPHAFATLITRRFMTHISERITFHLRADALVTGENLGQVASQTISGLASTDDASVKPILRPLLCFDKQEIIDIARKIGTYETSSLPYEDCCTVFTPRHPATRASLKSVKEAESSLDIAGLVDRAYAGIEKVKIT